MKNLTLDAFDATKISINLWDEVASPKGCVQIAHGMAEHPDRYEEFAKYLNSKGYIVAASDHRGHRKGAIHGENGQVYGDSWNQTLEDMDTLCDYLKNTYKLEVALLGHSYGSFLSQCYVERHSDKICGVILSGTAYMKSILIAMGLMVASVQKLFVGGHKKGKFINKLSFGAYNKNFVDQGQEFAWLSRDKEQVAKYQDDIDCGYTLCLDYYQSFFKGVMKMYGQDAKSIAKDFKIMIAVGGDDPVSNNSLLAAKLNNFYMGLGLKPLFKVYHKARHEILNEINRDEVYADMGNFIDTLYNKDKE